MELYGSLENLEEEREKREHNRNLMAEKRFEQKIQKMRKEVGILGKKIIVSGRYIMKLLNGASIKKMITVILMPNSICFSFLVF